MASPLFTESEWTFETLDRVFKAVEDIALNELKLSIYPNQIEIISTEQMLDAYSAMGMPLMYHHWSFGKLFAREEGLYRTGHRARIRDGDQFKSLHFVSARKRIR
jgi:stage V sporulation protein R